MQGQTSALISSRMFLKWKHSDWDLDKRNENCSSGWQKRMSLKILRKLIKIGFTGIIGLSGLRSTEDNQWFFVSLLLYKCDVSAWDFVGGIWTCSGGGYKFKHWARWTKTAVFGNFGQSKHYCKEHKSTFWSLKISL